MIKFDLNDILLVPSESSDIVSRKEDVDTHKRGYLPLYNAPMDRVIDSSNERLFDLNKINTVQVRGIKPILNHTITSVSLVEIIDLFIEGKLKADGRYLIDMANGHMKALLDTVVNIKSVFPDLYLMVGNVANPKTFKLLSEAGANAIRLSIGTGGSCKTTTHTAIGYPLGSLIKETYDLKQKYNLTADIIADGGMKNYSDIIKALALGANYVMVGGLLNKCIESAGKDYLFGKIKVSKFIAYNAYVYGIPMYKSMRGMATKEVQKDWGKTQLTSSEGKTSLNKVTHSVSLFVEEFDDYLRSAMSYVGAKTLDDFIGKVNFVNITQNAYNRYNK